MLYLTNKHHTSSHIAATPMLRLWLLAMTVLFALNASAVLKEKNLDNTLSILRSELANYHKDLERQTKFMKQQQEAAQTPPKLKLPRL